MATQTKTMAVRVSDELYHKVIEAAGGKQHVSQFVRSLLEDATATEFEKAEKAAMDGMLKDAYAFQKYIDDSVDNALERLFNKQPKWGGGIWQQIASDSGRPRRVDDLGHEPIEEPELIFKDNPADQEGGGSAIHG